MYAVKLVFLHALSNIINNNKLCLYSAYSLIALTTLQEKYMYIHKINYKY